MKKKLFFASLITLPLIGLGIFYIYSPVKLSAIEDCRNSGDYVYSEYKRIQGSNLISSNAVYLFKKAPRRADQCLVKIRATIKSDAVSEEIIDVYTNIRLANYTINAQGRTIEGDKVLFDFYNATIFDTSSLYDHKNRIVTSNNDGFIFKRGATRLEYFRMKKVFEGKYSFQ